jgi:hypothetical protein
MKHNYGIFEYIIAMVKELYKVPGKVVGNYHPDIHTIIDTWESLAITLEEWKASVYDVGIVDFAPKHGVIGWIIDTSQSQGVFKPEVQEFREKVARPKLAENGVRFLFVVLPQSAISKLSARKTARLYKGQGALEAHPVASVNEAVEMMKSAGLLQ